MAKCLKHIAAIGAAAMLAAGLAIAPAAAQTLSRELDRAAACVVVARTLAATGQITDAGQAARIQAIYSNAVHTQSRQMSQEGYSSDQISQIKSYYANRLARPVRDLVATGRPAAIDAVLGLCGDFG